MFSWILSKTRTLCTKRNSRWTLPRPRSHHGYIARRTLFAGVSPFILVPSVFVALLLGHWLHKCLLMVLFQNKIIYMPFLPPGSRRERLQDYARSCGPVAWTEQHIKSLDGTRIALAIGKLDQERAEETRKQKIILYFQGNGASLPPRTPMLSHILRATAEGSEHDWTIIALSYRGYWTSSGRAHQRGIEKDAEALLRWVASTYTANPENAEIILWGQSIGAGVAAFAAAEYIDNSDITSPTTSRRHVSKLILETPFISIKSMLAALYPDWWVPYRHLWPFLRSWWDSEEAIRKISTAEQPPKILMVVASRDEIVPRMQADQLELLCQGLKLDVQRREILGALHTQASTLEEGKNAISCFLRDDRGK